MIRLVSRHWIEIMFLSIAIIIYIIQSITNRNKSDLDEK